MSPHITTRFPHRNVIVTQHGIDPPALLIVPLPSPSTSVNPTFDIRFLGGDWSAAGANAASRVNAAYNAHVGQFTVQHSSFVGWPWCDQLVSFIRWLAMV